MPLLVGALFWRRSTKWGALACALWAAGSVIAVALFQTVVTTPGVAWSIGGVAVLERTPGGTAVFGFLPVVPMVIVSALLMYFVSLITKKPDEKTLSRYFTESSSH
jgi:Na+/proline symporter